MTEVEAPVPERNEVLIRVRAATVMMGDCELRAMRFSPSWQVVARMGFGFRAPRRKILGQDLAGEVESVGKDVRLFKKGDQVFANTGFHLGAYAEYDCLGEDGLIAPKPTNLSFEEAATLASAGMWALPPLRKANVRRGDKVLIIGAGGGLGSFAVQFAKSLGATVMAVDSKGKLEMLRSIGADAVVDYATDDYAGSGESYDVIFDIVGKSSLSACLRLLREDGAYLQGNPGLRQIARGLWASKIGGRRVIRGAGPFGPEDLAFLKGLVEAGKIRPVIDKTYPLEEIVEAHRYVDTGQKAGNVVIAVGEGGGS